MHWPPVHTEADGVLDFGHLDPFVMVVPAKQAHLRSRRLLVSFGCHTFTREVRDGDPDDRIVRDGADRRCFCPDRYRCSQELPGIVRRSAAGRVYFSSDRNLLIVDRLAWLEGPYAVFFNIAKSPAASHDAVMFIVSAYEKPNLPDRLPAITFATMIETIMDGRLLKPPRETRSIRR